MRGMGLQSAGQVWRGTVTRVLPDGMIWAVVPQLMGEEPLGPMPSHGAAAEGARVLVVLLGGSRQDMVAIPAPAGDYGDLDSRLDTVETGLVGLGNTVSGQGTRLSTAEQKHDALAGTVASMGAEFDSRLDAAELTLAVIRTPSKVWSPVNPAHASLVSHEWHPNHGWVSWLNFSAVDLLGDLSFTYPALAGTATAARPHGWEMKVICEGLTGVGGLRPKVDYMNGTTVVGSNAELSLTVYPNWAYSIEHDFILPANAVARPTFVALGVTTSAVGRIGLTAPFMSTRSERSQ